MSRWVGQNGSKEMERNSARLRTVRVKMPFRFEGKHYAVGETLRVPNSLAHELERANWLEITDDEAQRERAAAEERRQRDLEKRAAERAEGPAERTVRIRVRPLAGVQGGAILGPNLEPMEYGKEYTVPEAFLVDLGNRVEVLADPAEDARREELKQMLVEMGVKIPKHA